MLEVAELLWEKNKNHHRRDLDAEQLQEKAIKNVMSEVMEK